MRRNSSERGSAPACVVRILSVLRIIALPRDRFRNRALLGVDVVLLDDRRPASVIAPHQGVQLCGGGRRRVHALLLEVGLDFRKRKDGAQLGVELETTGAGVPLGAMNAYHMSTSAPFTPDSCRLGTSGAFGWRFALPTASALSLPALT